MQPFFMPICKIQLRSLTQGVQLLLPKSTRHTFSVQRELLAKKAAKSQLTTAIELWLSIWGGSKNTSAVRSALKISWAVENIINPKLLAQYPNCSYRVKQVVGIDTSPLLVAKTGIRSYNDLVWVGNSANYAAKLSNLSDFATYITDRIYQNIADSAKYSNGVDMWKHRTWTTQDNMSIYGSNYVWPIT